MYPYERDFFIARIKSGYLRIKYQNQVFKYQLTKDAIYESEEVFLDAYKQCLESDVLTDEKIYPFLIEQKLWTDEEEERLVKKLPEYIEKVKVEMYQSFSKPADVQRMRLYLNKVKDEIYKIFEVRHQFDYLSCNGAAIYARWHFLVQECVRNIDGSKVDWNNVNPHDILSLISNASIEESDIRYLARNDPWSTMWAISKKSNNIFDCAASDYTEDQRRLVSWSIHYDNVREYEDCPPDAIIEDDDCFDGWMILKRRKQETEKGQNKIENHINKHSNAQELFIPVKNQYSSDYLAADGSIIQTGEAPDKIFSMNNQITSSIIQSRVNAIKEANGPIKMADLPDIKFKVGMQANQIEHRIQGGK